MVRMIPSDGKIIMPANTPSLEETIKKGCWTPIWRTAIDDTTAEWQAKLVSEDGSVFHVEHFAQNSEHGEMATVNWTMSGLHSVNNGLVAIAAAYNVGVSVEKACKALSNFAGIKRRMELVGTIAKNDGNIEVYDDFAHHPTAIQTTLDGAKKRFSTNPNRKIWAVIEPRSNTMKLGTHQGLLAPSSSIADHVIWYQPANLDWSVTDAIGDAVNQQVMTSTDDIIKHIKENIGDNDAVIIMSNGGFEGIHGRLVKTLQG